MKNKELQNALTYSKYPPRSMYVCVALHKKHLWPPSLTSLHLFLNGALKAAFTARLCSLKCSRAATDPQILTFKPSGGKSKQQEGEIEMGKGGVKKRVQAWAERWMGGEMSSGGCWQISDRGGKFALAKHLARHQELQHLLM